MNLAHSATRDSAAHFQNLVDMKVLDSPVVPLNACILSGRESFYIATPREFADLTMVGSSITSNMSVTTLPIAYVMGVHFRSGEWGSTPRCGSVITCVIRGHGSLYARVNRFLRVDGDECPGYASVTWFSKPRYLFDRNPLGVCVGLNGLDLDRELGSIVRVTQIDPSRVMVERDGDEYMMMRESGWDTRE